MNESSPISKGRGRVASDGERLSHLTLAIYTLPVVGVGYMTGMLLFYLLKYATDALLIAPGAMGAIFGLSRAWDALCDPLAGYLSDQTNTRFGRRRPWLFASALPLGLFFVAMWGAPASLLANQRILWMAFAVLLFYSASTAFYVPHASLGAELTTDYHERTRVFAARQIWENAGLFLALGGVFALEHSAKPRATALSLSIIAAVFVVATIPTAAALLHERPDYRGRGGGSAYSAFVDVWKNPHARVLLAATFLQELGFATLPTLTPYVSDYVLRTPGYTAYYMLCSFVPFTISIPAWLRLSRRHGKRTLWVFSNILNAIAFAAAFFVREGQWLAVILLIAAIGAAFGCGRMMAPSIQADVIDYDELATGQRKEGVYFAASGLVAKAAGAISIMIMGFALQLSGFRPNVEQTASIRLVLRFLFAIFPLLLSVGAIVILMRFSLNEPEHAEIRRALEQRLSI